MSTENTNEDAQLTAIEFDIEWNEKAWWAACHVDGTLAIGSGPNVWEAIGAAIADIPRSRAWSQRMAEIAEQAKAGTFRCPGCGELRPAMTPETMPWAFFCGPCRGEDWG